MPLPEIPGFRELEPVYTSARTQVLRALRDDGQRVVFKGLAPGRADARALARMAQEHRILKDLRADGVVRAWGIHETPLGTLLELEDAGRSTLAQHARAALSLEAFLDLALRVTSAVANLHEAGVIHRDLTPANIACSTELTPSGAPVTLKLIDFDLATRLRRETIEVGATPHVEGTPG